MNKLTILITGGCGFIGSNLSILIKQRYPAYRIICMDNLKRRGSELNINRLKEAGIEFIHGDIRNKEDFDIEVSPNIIIEAAAEPSVLAGMNSSLNYLIDTNLTGTINTLYFAAKTKAKFIFLSTSRVYPITYLEQIKYTESDDRFILSDIQNLPGVSSNGINEQFLLNSARSVYGATKLASELMIEEFREFFGVNFVINRCGVVAGPYQMGKVDQGVITLWVARHYWKQDVSYFGYNGMGKQVRDVLHIEDLFELINYQIHNFDEVKGQIFNAGGGLFSTISLKELTAVCSEITGNVVKANSVPETRKGDIPIYITDNRKVSGMTGWLPQKNIEKVVGDIYSWINQNEKFLKPILLQ